MKILRIKAAGLPLYKQPFDISFLASQRVYSNHLGSVFNLFGNIYTNTVELFIGINASGKTSALNIISFASMLLNAVPLNSNSTPRILGDNNNTIFEIDFYDNNQIYRLTTELVKLKKSDGTYEINILSEKLLAKKASSKNNRRDLFNFKGTEIIRNRANSGEYLPKDVSIMIAANRQIIDKCQIINESLFTNFNLFSLEGSSVPAEIITLLDPTVEYINIENINDKTVTRLKFFNQKELILLNPYELNIYLSSGTVKGIRVFSDAIKVLHNGGYLIIDEIENHFHYELAASILRLFMNNKTNPKGAVIIASTHYHELLDEIKRNDPIFITRSSHGLTVDNLSTLIDRNDMKKSEVYQSNYLKGTAPKYSALSALKESIIRNFKE